MATSNGGGMGAKKLSIEDELNAASDKIKHLESSVGVLQTGTNVIHEPKTQHDPCFLNCDDIERWIVQAELHAKERVTKTEEGKYDEINIENILDDVNTARGEKKKCRKVLFLGPAGIGKTRVLNRLSFHKLLEGKIVILPDFRRFRPSGKLAPSQVFLSSMFPDDDSERIKHKYQWMKDNSSKIAFIVDSLDTLPFDFSKAYAGIHDDQLASLDVIAHNFFSGKLFRDSVILSSSREFKVKNIHESVWPHRCVIIDGLKDESVKALLKEFLGEERASKVMDHIEKECPDIWPLLHIPVFLQFSAVAFALGDDSLLPNTMSGVLIKYLQNFVRSKHAHVPNISDVLCKLMPMCFKAMKRARVEFAPDDLHSFKVKVSDVTDLCTILQKSDGLLSLSDEEKHDGGCSFYFNHQTLQECLAALHVLSVTEEKFKDLNSSEVDNENFTLVCRLIWGILCNEKVLEAAMEFIEIPDVEKKKCILQEDMQMRLKQALLKKDQGKVLEIYIRLNEAKEKVIDEGIRSCIQKIDFQLRPLNPSDVQAIAFVMARCVHLDEVNLYRTNLNDSKIDILARPLKDSGVRIDHLNLRSNYVSKKMPVIVKLAKHCDTKSLDIGLTKLQAEALHPILEENTGGQFKELIVDGNKELEASGWYTVGYMMNKNAIKLNAKNCNLDSEKVAELSKGLGRKQVDTLNLEGSGQKYTPALLGLLPCVSKEIDLAHWEINDTEKQELQTKLDKIASPNLTVSLRWDTLKATKRRKEQRDSDLTEDRSRFVEDLPSRTTSDQRTPDLMKGMSEAHGHHSESHTGVHGRTPKKRKKKKKTHKHLSHDRNDEGRIFSDQRAKEVEREKNTRKRHSQNSNNRGGEMQMSQPTIIHADMVKMQVNIAKNIADSGASLHVSEKNTSTNLKSSIPSTRPKDSMGKSAKKKKKS